MTTPVSGTIARDDSLVELLKRSKEDLRRCLCLDAQRNAHHLHCKNRCNKLETCPYGQALLMKMGMRDVPESIARQLASEQEKPVKVEPFNRPKHGLIQQIILNGDYATYRMVDGKMVMLTETSKREYDADTMDEIRQIVNAWDMLHGKEETNQKQAEPVIIVRKGNNRTWTDEEEQIVRDNITMKAAELKKLLPGKDTHSIDCKKYRLKKEIGNA